MENHHRSRVNHTYRIAIVVVLFLFSGEAAMASPPSRESTPRNYIGAPIFKYTTLRGQGAVMAGVRVGWNITQSLLLGGGAYETISEVNGWEGTIPDAPSLLLVKFECFGTDLEYAIHRTAPTHLTMTAFMGGAAARYAQDKNDNQWGGVTDFMFLLEPSVGVEQRITDSIQLNLAVSYRLVSGVEQPGLKGGDFQGAAAVLGVKIVQF